MMNNKRIMHAVICVQLVMMLVMFTACGNKSNPVKETATTAEQETTTEEIVTTTKEPEKKEEETITVEEETTLKKIDYEKMVTDAYHEKLGESDLSIPKINLEGDGIQKINEEIWTKCYDEQVKSEMDGNGIGKTMSYTWGVHEDVLSVCISVKMIHYEDTLFYVYNVLIPEEKSCSNNELLTHIGMNEADYRELAKKGMYSCFFEKNSALIDNDSPDMITMLNEVLEKTISDENVNEAQPFLNENGQLCIACKIYSVAGASYYETLVNLNGFTPNERYPQLLEMPAEQQNLLTEEDALRIAEETIGYRQGQSGRETRTYSGQTFEDGFMIEISDWGTSKYNGRDAYVFTAKKYHDSMAPVYTYLGTIYVDIETGECTVSEKMYSFS